MTDQSDGEVSQYADKQINHFHEFLRDSAYHAGERDEDEKEKTLRHVKSEFENLLDDLGVKYDG